MSKKNKNILIYSILFLIIIVSGITIWAKKRQPNFNKLSNQEVLTYLANKKVPKTQIDSLTNRVNKIPRGTTFQYMRTLPAKQQAVFRQNTRLIAETRFDSMIKHFFSLPLDQRNQFLDKQIAQMQQRIKFFQARIQTETGNQIHGRGNWARNRTPAEQLQRRANMLAATTPAERAERTAYFQALQQRMKQLGITPRFGISRGPL